MVAEAGAAAKDEVDEPLSMRRSHTLKHHPQALLLFLLLLRDDAGP